MLYKAPQVIIDCTIVNGPQNAVSACVPRQEIFRNSPPFPVCEMIEGSGMGTAVSAQGNDLCHLNEVDNLLMFEVGLGNFL